jgi:hypothetical protein
VERRADRGGRGGREGGASCWWREAERGDASRRWTEVGKGRPILPVEEIEEGWSIPLTDGGRRGGTLPTHPDDMGRD